MLGHGGFRPELSGRAREARREAASDRAMVASGPARPNRGAALMPQARAWRALPRQAEHGVAHGARWSRGSDRWASVREAAADRWVPHVSDFPILENLKNHLSAQEN
jgi:hypothetical protein